MRPLEIYIHASLASPPHRVTHPNKLNELINQFELFGWDKTKPDLIGYSFENNIQLITGSHRWAAAKETSTIIPAKIYPYWYIESIWGSEAWVKLIEENT